MRRKDKKCRKHNTENKAKAFNSFTPRHRHAFPRVLGPRLLSLYLLSLNVSVNVIFIVLNVRLKKKGVLE